MNTEYLETDQLMSDGEEATITIDVQEEQIIFVVGVNEEYNEDDVCLDCLCALENTGMNVDNLDFYSIAYDAHDETVEIIYVEM